MPSMTDAEQAVIEEFANGEFSTHGHYLLLRDEAVAIRDKYPHDQSIHARFMREAVGHPCPDPILRGSLRFTLKQKWSERNG